MRAPTTTRSGPVRQRLSRARRPLVRTLHSHNKRTEGSGPVTRNGQLVSTTSYGWDADSNRTSVDTTDQPTQTATFNNADQLTTLSGGYGYSYDDDGRLTEIDKSGAPTQATYTYNNFGELSATSTNGSSVNFTRDALGRIDSRSDGTNTSAIYYDGTSNAVAGYGPPGAVSRLIRDPLGVVLVAATPNQPKLHAHTSIHGDLAEWANEASGAVTASTIYDPFGQPSTAGAPAVPLGFQSMLTDPTSGLVDMGTRAYQPSLDLFTTPDNYPGDLTHSVTLNRYAYGNADPVSIYDPDGHCSLNPFSDDDCYSEAADAVDDTVTSAVNTVTDKVKSVAKTAGSTVAHIASSLGQQATDAINTVVNRARDVVNNVVAHGTQVIDDIQHGLNQLVHDPRQAIAAVASTVLGAGVFAGCEALTIGAGSAGCLALAGAAAGGLYGATTCTDGQAILDCAAKGAIAGTVTAATFAATGGLGGAALAGTTGNLTSQLLDTCSTGCHIDIDQAIAAGVTAGGLAAVPSLARGVNQNAHASITEFRANPERGSVSLNGAAETSPRLSLDRIRITGVGVDAIGQHLSRFVDPGGSLGGAEAGMLARLQKITAGDLSPTGQDLRFYSHELRESVLYRQAGFPTGQPLGADESYALWDALHTAALNDYGFPRAIPPDFLYHPSVLSEPLP